MVSPADPNEPLTDFINGILHELRALSWTSDSNSATGDQTKKELPLAARPYILTLHVLYPHAFLDALDLLDRGLVTRLLASARPIPPDTASDADANATLRREIIDEMAADDAARAKEGAVDTEASHPASLTEHKTETAPDQPQPALRVMYSVRSAQVPHHRQASSSTESAGDVNLRSYQVFLRAWHCSCPAFALAAFQPAEEQSLHPEALQRLRSDIVTTDAERTGELPEGLRFGFGGLPASRLEQAGANRAELPPACKHLLACVLAEAAPGLFARQCLPSADDGERMQGPQGMAGLVEKWISADEAAAWAVGAGHL